MSRGKFRAARYTPVDTHMTRRLLLTLSLAFSAAWGQKAPLRAPDVRYEPSSPEQTMAMLRLAGVSRKDMVYDLGCGDGRLVITAAQKFGARGVGIDIDPQRIAESVANAQKAGVSRLVKFRNEDLFTADIHKATVVTLFLVALDQPEAAPQTVEGTQARHARGLALSRHGRLGAGEADRSGGPQDLPVDHPGDAARGDGLRRGALIFWFHERLLFHERLPPSDGRISCGDGHPSAMGR